MRIVLCGVRGSTPAPGQPYVRYGGHTSCVAVAHDHEPDPVLVLDGGTGLMRISELMGTTTFRGTLLLGHLHWDHTHGLPFFAPGARPDSRVDVRLPDQGEDAEAVLTRAFSPPHFPVLPSVLGPGWSFSSLHPGLHELEGFTVLARDIPHKGGRTFGYRISDGRSSFAYLSDHSPVALGAGPEGLGEYHESALELAADVDVLVHDAQHTASEFPGVAYLGHSAVEYVVGLAQRAGSRSVLLFHHGPQRTDDEIDAIVAAHVDAPVPVAAAREGLVLPLPAAVPVQTASVESARAHQQPGGRERTDGAQSALRSGG